MDGPEASIVACTSDDTMSRLPLCTAHMYCLQLSRLHPTLPLPPSPVARARVARAREQEMTAQVVEMESRVKEAEAEVPRAMSEAFRSGNLGIMDYYRMRNIEADTDMRDSISDSSPEDEKTQDDN